MDKNHALEKAVENNSDKEYTHKNHKFNKFLK